MTYYKLTFFSLSGLFFLLGGVGCTKKAQTVSTAYEPVRVIETPVGGGPAFVTDRPAPVATEPKPTEVPVLPSVSEPAVVSVSPKEEMPALSFAVKETQHVRLTDYNLFGSDSEITMDLARLGEDFCYPYPGNLISDYGTRHGTPHTGVDIKAVPNDTIRAAWGGTVRMSKLYSGYGNVVVIRHPNGLETVYAHNSKNLVKPNDVVRAGQAIALAGRTGQATTEHLHFEVRMTGEHFDPNLILDVQNRTLKSGTLYLQRRDGRLYASNSFPEKVPMKPVVMVSNTPVSKTLVAQNTVQVHSAVDIPAIHIVQKGDTLFSLSRKYGVTVDRICALNDIPRDGILNLGQRIKLQ